MTTLTTNLGLTTYNTVTDGSSLVNTYIEDVSGSVTSNLTKLDLFAGNTNASLTAISSACYVLLSSSSSVPNGRILTAGDGITIAESSASIVTVGATTPSTASYVVLELNNNLSNEWLLTAGTGISLTQDASASTVTLASTGGVTIASASTVNQGTNNTDAISASALSQSNYGYKTCVVPLNTSASLTTADHNYVRIPDELNGWILANVRASCSGSSTSGSPTFTVESLNSSSASVVNMLSTNVSIDEGEYDSLTATTPVSISTSTSAVFLGYRIKIGVSSSGSSVTYAQVSLGFRGV